MLGIEDIERFFEAKFAAMKPGPGVELHHFDGFVHWSVICTDDKLYVSADNQIGGSAFSVVELTVYCSRVSTSSAGGVGPTLILHPEGSDEVEHVVVLTKTRLGRISLCTTQGAGPDSCRAELKRK